MAHVRKNQAKLAKREWDAFMDALNATMRNGAEAPRYRDFVKVHEDAMTGAGMHQWGVHSMDGMVGRNFLAWHRWYLVKFERRLQEEDQTVTLPYWDWMADQRLPQQLNRRALLQRWNVDRSWDKPELPTKTELRDATKRERFRAFQRRLEWVHNDVHVAAGGTMATASSPADPLFWLHHANVDRLWARWQERHPRQRPGNGSEQLEPPPIFGKQVSGVLDISKLGYRYG